MPSEPIYDHALIRRLIESEPHLALNSDDLAKKYNEVKGSEEITPESMRGVVYRNHRKWFGKDTGVKRGRRAYHDKQRVRDLYRLFPRSSAQEIADLYNGGWVGPPITISAIYKIMDPWAQG